MKHTKSCCCNCTNRRVLVKHPFNKEEWAKGQISEKIGYVCMMPFEDGSQEDRVMYMTHGCGECELHNRKL